MDLLYILVQKTGQNPAHTSTELHTTEFQKMIVFCSALKTLAIGVKRLLDVQHHTKIELVIPH